MITQCSHRIVKRYASNGSEEVTFCVEDGWSTADGQTGHAGLTARKVDQGGFSVTCAPPSKLEDDEQQADINLVELGLQKAEPQSSNWPSVCEGDGV